MTYTPIDQDDPGYTPSPLIYTKKIAVDSKQLACLATNVFYEARGESYSGQLAVALVTMNRVSHGFAKTPCGVVYQSFNVERVDEETGESRKVKLCQFSWVCEARNAVNKHSPAYKQAEKIARGLLNKTLKSDLLPSNTLFFHNSTVNPKWPYRQIAQIGNHTFYTKQRASRS